MKSSSISLILITLIYAMALWMWALPIEEMPFGDVDSAGHFILGDYMAQKDKSIYKLPQFIVPMYGFANNNKLWYAPQYHTNEAIFQILTGQKIVGVYIWVLIASTLVIITTFFVMKKLYGIAPAAAASFLLAFSARDYMTYLWAQWPQAAAYAFVAPITYFYYKYTESKEGKHMYIAAALLAMQYWFHPQAIAHSILAIAVYTTFLTIKNKKLPINAKTLAITAAIFIIMMLPFFHFSLSSIISQSTGDAQKAPITRLFSWYPDYNQYKGFIPEDYFSYGKMHGIWTLPLLLIGIAFLALRRENKDMMMLSWLASYYIITHLDIVGIMTGRLHRAMFAEAHIFYPIIALGLVALPSLMKGEAQKYAKYALIAVFVMLAINFNAKPCYSQLNTAYDGIGRISPAQYNAAMWAVNELPQDKGLRIAGTLVPAKKKWIGFLAYKIPVYDYELFGEKSAELNMTDYVLVDYNDALMAGRRDIAEAILAWEKQNYENKTSLYNKDNIRVYEVG